MRTLFLSSLVLLVLLAPVLGDAATPVLLTDSVGENQHPSWSPDGQYIYFESNRAGTSHIFRIPVAGGPLLQLTFGGVDEKYPEVSPDGTEVAYATRVGLGYTGRLYKVPSGGGAPIQLTFPVHPEDLDWHPAWMPDGSKVVFCRRQGVDHDDFDLMSVPAAGGVASHILNLSRAQCYPGISSNGLWIAFENNLGGPINVYQAPLSDPTNLTQLTFENVNTGQPRYSPDGTQLAYVSRKVNGFLDLYLMDLTTLQSTRLTFDGDGGSDPRTQDPVFSPDGSKIAFTSKREIGSHNVWILDLDDPEPEPILVDFDLRTERCPNTVNRNSGGRLKAAIKGNEDFDVTTINSASLLLEGSLIPGRILIKDTGTPSPGPCECSGNGRDQILDLFMEFDTGSVVKLLSASPSGELVLTGALLDGTPFEGSDCLRYVPDHARMRDGGPVIQVSPGDGGAGARIQYRTESEGLVNLQVYDVAGRLVVNLVNAHMPAGEFVVDWPTLSRPSGVYFFRLQTPDAVHVGKTLVLR